MVFANCQQFKPNLFELHIIFSELYNLRLLIMPLPLGHSAIGFATHYLVSNNKGTFNNLKLATFIIILSNLPDIDVLLGLIFQNNGSAFHRGPTHSILFALIMGFAASKSSKLCSQIPMIGFRGCFCLIFSHVVADYFLTHSPVSFFWPFEVCLSTGNLGWSQIFNIVFWGAMKDAEILITCIFIIMLCMILGRFYLFRKTKLSALNVLRGQKEKESKQKPI